MSLEEFVLVLVKLSLLYENSHCGNCAVYINKITISILLGSIPLKLDRNGVRQYRKVERVCQSLSQAATTETVSSFISPLAP
jgi:hypothetical protein